MAAHESASALRRSESCSTAGAAVVERQRSQVAVGVFEHVVGHEHDRHRSGWPVHVPFPPNPLLQQALRFARILGMTWAVGSHR